MTSIKEKTPITVLNRLWHDDAFDFNKVEVVYTSRGAPLAEARVKGLMIAKIEGSFIVINQIPQTSIPSHRIKLILHDSEIMYDRQKIKHGENNCCPICGSPMELSMDEGQRRAWRCTNNCQKGEK